MYVCVCVLVLRKMFIAPDVSREKFFTLACVSLPLHNPYERKKSRQNSNKNRRKQKFRLLHSEKGPLPLKIMETKDSCDAFRCYYAESFAAKHKTQSFHRMNLHARFG